MPTRYVYVYNEGSQSKYESTFSLKIHDLGASGVGVMPIPGFRALGLASSAFNPMLESLIPVLRIPILTISFSSKSLNYFRLPIFYKMTQAYVEN